MASQESSNNRAPAPQVAFCDQVLHHVNKSSQMREDLIQRTNLLRGVIFTPDGLRPSTWDILDFKDELPAASMNNTIYEVSSVKNIHARTFMENGWTGGAINSCIPWISLTCGISLLDNSDTTFSCAFSHRVRGLVDFNVHKLRSSVRSEFRESVSTALQAGIREEVQNSLRAVFNRSGHLFQTRIWLGSNSQCSGSVTDIMDRGSKLPGVLYTSVREWKNAQSVDVDANIERNTRVRIRYRTNGGQSSLAEDVSSWLQSTERYQGWVVTKVEKAVPIIELLEPEICQQVIGAFAPLIGKWVMSGEFPDMTAHPEWYWLCQPKMALEGESEAQYLIVQDRVGTALIPAPTPAVVGESDGFTAYASTAVPGFEVLGAFVWDKAKPFDFSGLRAVRRDLLVRGTDSVLFAISDAVTALVAELPNTAVALGDPVHAIETKHIILQVARGNRVILTPEPLLLSKYAIDIQGAVNVVST